VSAAGVRVARIDEIPPAEWEHELEWRPVRRHLGIEAFGVNAWAADAGKAVIVEHDETGQGADEHQELYVVVRGRVTFTIGGEPVDAPAGTLVAITDPALLRSGVAAEDGTLILAVGAPRGRAYTVSPWESRRSG
jgi:hypothetical protein